MKKEQITMIWLQTIAHLWDIEVKLEAGENTVSEAVSSSIEALSSFSPIEIIEFVSDILGELKSYCEANVNAL